MKSTINICKILFVSLFFVQLKAGILVEPRLALNLSGSGSNNTTKFSYGGTQYGLRLGGDFLGFMGGFDVNASSFTLKRTTTQVYSDDMSRTEYGVFVGYNFPILLRAWAAYYFDSTATDQDSGGLTVSGYKYSGSSFEIGVGYTALPFISINAIYKVNSISKETSNVGVVTNYSGASAIANNEILLGVSLPISL